MTLLNSLLMFTSWHFCLWSELSIPFSSISQYHRILLWYVNLPRFPPSFSNSVLAFKAANIDITACWHICLNCNTIWWELTRFSDNCKLLSVSTGHFAWVSVKRSASASLIYSINFSYISFHKNYPWMWKEAKWIHFSDRVSWSSDLKTQWGNKRSISPKF